MSGSFEKIGISRIILYTLLFTMLILVVMLGISPDKFISDERYFMANLNLLGDEGFTFRFLRDMKLQSPGPLFQYLYYPVGLVIPLTPKIMRIFNFLFLGGNLFLLHRLIREQGVKNAWIIALLIMAIPMTWVDAGMAFTDLPSLFFALLGIFLLNKAVDLTGNTALICAVAAGLCEGLGIIGRSPYLMILPAALVLFMMRGKSLHLILFIVFSAIFPAILFYAWGGLVPPDCQGIQSGLKPEYITLFVLYFSVTNLIINPQLFVMKKMHYLIALILFVIFFAINASILKISYLPMNGILTAKRIPALVFRFLPYVAPSLVAGFCYLFVLSLYKNFRENTQTPWTIFLLAATFLIMGTTAKSTAHFTSKYVMEAYPFFLVYIARFVKIDKYLLLRIIIGAIAGIASLHSYYAAQALY